MDGSQGIPATVCGCSHQTSMVRLNVGAEGLDHDQLGQGKVRS